MLAILTRWHVDDPIGRLKGKLGDDVKVITYKAVAEHDEQHRLEGDALFPELKSLDMLESLRGNMLEENWQSLYQQKRMVEVL